MWRSNNRKCFERSSVDLQAVRRRRTVHSTVSTTKAPRHFAGRDRRSNWDRGNPVLRCNRSSSNNVRRPPAPERRRAPPEGWSLRRQRPTPRLPAAGRRVGRKCRHQEAEVRRAMPCHYQLLRRILSSRTLSIQIKVTILAFFDLRSVAVQLSATLEQ